MMSMRTHFTVFDYRDELKRRRRDPEVVTHRYINCSSPFDPASSALGGLCRYGNALRIMFGAFADEYESAIASGRSDAWHGAVVAAANLFMTPIIYPVSEVLS